jgi:hypothetical protein
LLLMVVMEDWLWSSREDFEEPLGFIEILLIN